MELKLIESGGFAGLSRSAVLEMEDLSPHEQALLRQFISGRQEKALKNNPDSLQYQLVYDGKTIALPELTEHHDVLLKIFERLKSQLRY